MAHEERQHGGGQRPGQHRDVRAGGQQHAGHVAGERRGAVTGVVADHDPGRALIVADAVGQPAPEASGGATHHDPVHAGRPRPHGGAQTGGAEAQGAGETIGQRCGGLPRVGR